MSEPEIIDISDFDSEHTININNSDDRRGKSSKFGSGIELLMNDKKKNSIGGGSSRLSSDIDVNDLNNLENELNDFYKEVSKYSIDKIIRLDETSFGSHLKPAYSRCYIGKRCVIKTNNNFVFRSFTLLVAINNKKCVGKIFYEKGGTTQERMVDFLETQIFPKYKDHLIILDNAKSHNNQMVKDAITKSGNKYLFSIPYTPMTNSPIENYFNQIKTYIKKKRNVNSFEELAKNVDTSIERVKPENYKNYFEYAYGTTKKTEYTRKSSTLKHKLKLYKDV